MGIQWRLRGSAIIPTFRLVKLYFALRYHCLAVTLVFQLIITSNIYIVYIVYIYIFPYTFVRYLVTAVIVEAHLASDVLTIFSIRYYE